MAALPAPRLAIMGTLDARLDLALLEQLALARPAQSLVFIGPVRTERIDARRLLAPLCTPWVRSPSPAPALERRPP